MSKKKRRKSTDRVGGSAPISSKSKKSNKLTIIALAVGLGLVVAGIYFLTGKEQPQRPTAQLEQPKKANLQLRETRDTLPPQRFSGRAFIAYQIAREIPEVLDRLYCYCRCRENFGHKNLLSCYVDTHAST